MRVRPLALLNSKTRKKQTGMTLVEILVASVVLMIGLVGVLSMFGYLAAVMSYSDEEMIARQKAREALESVIGARNSADYSWADIANVSNGGIFKDGATAMTNVGSDGIVNTSDDTGVETITLPNGKTRKLSEFTRQVAIAPAMLGGATSTTLSTVTITITYPRGRFGTGSYSVVGYISSWN